MFALSKKLNCKQQAPNCKQRSCIQEKRSFGSSADSACEPATQHRDKRLQYQADFNGGNGRGRVCTSVTLQCLVAVAESSEVFYSDDYYYYYSYFFFLSHFFLFLLISLIFLFAFVSYYLLLFLLIIIVIVILIS